MATDIVYPHIQPGAIVQRFGSYARAQRKSRYGRVIRRDSRYASVEWDTGFHSRIEIVRLELVDKDD